MKYDNDEVRNAIDIYLTPNSNCSDKDISIIGWAFGREVSKLLLEECSKVNDPNLIYGLAYAAYIINTKYIQPKEIKENENN